MGRRQYVARFLTGFSLAVGTVCAVGIATPAAAQFSDSYKFLKAIRDADGNEASKMMQSSGPTIINTRDYTTGEAALHIVVKRRDMTWLTFLLAKGANPDVRDNAGNTPLIAAAQLGFTEGAELLLGQRAKIDQSNNSGETPLIIATQQRNVPLVRLLVTNGADPKKTDRIAGKSAHDYAKDDARGTAVLKILDDAPATKAKPKMSGPGL